MIERAIVDDRDEVGRDLAADHVGEDADVLAVEVGLHAVADRLVQQDAAGSGREHHGQLAGRRAAGVEQDHRAIDGLARDVAMRSSVNQSMPWRRARLE